MAIILNKLKLLNERWYKIYGAALGKVSKVKKGYQGRARGCIKPMRKNLNIKLVIFS
ncbi:MAG: hypothetical protein ABIK60_03255 [candidate division WOR-3 bacterium]